MSEPIKVSQEDIQKINGLRDVYRNLAFQKGQITFQIMDIQETINQLEKLSEEIESKYKGLRDEENKLATELRTKYGNGNINLEDGTFTPLPAVS